ncbi:hypothetical protein GGI02_004838, partial [Coemansia sp. RSA 2322]
MDNYAHIQQSTTALRVRLQATTAAAKNANTTHTPISSTRFQPQPSYGSTDDPHRMLLPNDEYLPSQLNDEDSSEESRPRTRALEVADDRNPVCAFYEVATIRSLLLEHVSLVLLPGQIHSPDVQLNLVLPLWRATTQRCGVKRRGDMRLQCRKHCHQSPLVDAVLVDALGSCLVAETEYGETGVPDILGSPGNGQVASAAILYAALANRDYFLILASAGQSQAELHESRAQVAEELAILCAKALHKLGNQTLANALCAKFTPTDLDGLHAEMVHNMTVLGTANSTTPSLENLRHDSSSGRPLLPNPIRGERHMSLLSAEQRVRVYRLGQAGHVKSDGGSEPPTRPWLGSRPSRTASEGCMPIHELAQGYLSNGSRIVAERALGVAIRTEAKRFTAQKLVGEVVRLLWDGTLHWKGFSCVCLAAPEFGQNDAIRGAGTGEPDHCYAFAHRHQSSGDVSDDNAENGHAESVADLLPMAEVDYAAQRSCSTANEVLPGQVNVEKWLACALSPLRIPMFENILTMLHAFFFLALYTVVTLERQHSISTLEVVLHVCALAYIFEEIRQCKETGLAVYLKSVWNVLDVAIYAVFMTFLCLRIRCLYTGSAEDLDKAYDILTLNASMLWPRLFAVLDQFEFCGTVIIQVRRIISGTSLFFALLIVMTTGFFQTFYSLSRRHNELEARSICGLMARIFFGSALLGWDQASLFGPHVGYLIMSMYIGVSMLILYNILIGVINQCMVEITHNAAQEFRFAYTMRVVEYVSANQTYPCIPPLNLLQLSVLWPLRKTPALSRRTFVLLRSVILLAFYAPHLALYVLYKQAGRWWRAKSGMHRK